MSEPHSWREVEQHFLDVLSEGDYSEALFFHCAGTLAGDGSVVNADADDYLTAVLLNSASGQVLGRAFLRATSVTHTGATLLMCSSPAASDALSGLSHYCAGKAALEHWTRAIGVELGDGPDAPRVFSVIPHAVDTPMVRGAMAASAVDVPLGEFFRKAATQGALATPQQAAEQIWAGISGGWPQGATLPVGAVQSEPAATAASSAIG